MIPAFASLFSGDLAAYGDRFALASEMAPSSPGSDLVDPERLTELLVRFGSRRYPGADRRAVTSLWAKYHFATLLPPFLAIALLAEQELDVDIEAIGCTFSDDGATQSIHLRDAGKPAAPADAVERFLPLMDNHLVPVIAALATVSGVSRKVLWSNAGNMFDFIVRRVEQAVGSRQPVADALALMATRRLPDGRPNPLFDPVRYPDDRDGPKRLRRVCCIRYLIPELGYCSTCPLPDARS
ncbi:siderophore-iron reductase FhuF [Bosea sp. (in: a-proteobacteria)]|jgi:ferric iron reductase protein FhuF|uniref:siderophore-iron reductase FhuF n=1 Tax=Bosea sp. (in: a-proteobacteria) TaxID=1871050 RepID=UPI002DDD9C1A|nr:siderophore-iron reductase FhuF [Bosea sp. (in: a-proteobacteria)]HEV2512924.1 siderophore-iron reductase FhuF [Bosea sp. (in: a-proteobacteria)]